METNDDNHKNIDPVKTGNFIKKLRLSHNWTQDELGEKIFISRKSVSKWETGKCCPSIDMLKRLSETLGVSFDDLISGEFTDVEEEPKSVIQKIISNKKVRITSEIVVAFLFGLLLLFFIYNYNTTKIYKLSYEDDNFVIDNGVIVISKSKNYINIGDFYVNFPDVTSDTDFEFILYTYDGNNKYEMVKQVNNKTPTSLKNASDELFANTMKNSMNNIFLNIRFVNIYNEVKEYDLKLTVSLDFMNNFKYLFDYEDSSEVLEENSPMLLSDSDLNEDYNKEFDLTFMYENYDSLLKLDKTSIKIDDKNYFVTVENNVIKISNNELSLIFIISMKKFCIKGNADLIIDINENNILKIDYSMSNYISLIEGIINLFESYI